ncbi:MAG: hypothetical protein JWP18_903, partial [Solirubrobacterales bacterium]|nr:hypothetical protein [Solirubrobacterales bacterium]
MFEGTDDINAQARTLDASGAQMRRLWAEGISG